MNGYKIVLLKAIFMLYKLPESERVCSRICTLKRKLLHNGATDSSMFSMYMVMGDKENAKKILIRMILSDSQIQNALNSTPDNLQNAMAKYSKPMKEVGLTFDANKAIVYKNMF